MPAVAGRCHGGPLATTKTNWRTPRTWPTLPCSSSGQAERNNRMRLGMTTIHLRRRWASQSRTCSDSLTCKATSGSGVRIGTRRIPTSSRLLRTRLVRRPVRFAYCVVAVGTRQVPRAGRRFGMDDRLPTGVLTLAFGSSKHGSRRKALLDSGREGRPIDWNALGRLPAEWRRDCQVARSSLPSPGSAGPEDDPE